MKSIELQQFTPEILKTIAGLTYYLDTTLNEVSIVHYSITILTKEKYLYSNTSPISPYML